MKRYSIPIIVIVVVGVGTYFWTSHSNANRALAKAKKAHLDSLRVQQTTRMTLAAAQPIAHDTLSDSQRWAHEEDSIAKELRTVWRVQRLISMPDSILPHNFSEASIKYEFEGDFEVDSSGREDTLGVELQQRHHAFVNYTVMAMLMRHLVGTVETDEFSRCPSGYFAVESGQDSAAEIGWDTGTVYFGAGCNDTVVCDFRYNYPHRLVEMKDVHSTRFMSLRQFELQHFRQYAEAVKKE